MSKKQIHLSSITMAAADRFLASANDRDTLSCQNVTGLVLIKLAKGGSWRWRYTDAAGKRRVATVGSYATMKPEEAARKVLDWNEAGADPLATKATRRKEAQAAITEAERRTLRHYLDTHYIPHMERSWKARNVKANIGRIGGHFAHLLDRDMATIDKADINDWQRQAERAGKTHATIRRTVGALKTMLRQAVKDDVLQSDPLAKHKLLAPSLKDQRREISDDGKAERRMLAPGEIQGVLTGLELFAEEIRAQRRNSRTHGKPDLPDLDAVNHPHWFIPFCHLALHTGLRPGDLYSLKWEELNIRFGRLTKVCEKTSHAARSGKKPAVVDMKLNDTIKGIMGEWHRDCGKPDSGLVFPSPRTGRELDSLAHRKPWAHVKRLGGLDDNLNFYSLRHHFISALLVAGVPIFTVAKLVGHKSTAMIEQHYGHLCPDQATVALDIVAATVTGKAKRGAA